MKSTTSASTGRTTSSSTRISRSPAPTSQVSAAAEFDPSPVRHDLGTLFGQAAVGQRRAVYLVERPDDDVRPCLGQQVGVVGPRDADRGHVAGLGGLDAG